MDSARSLIEPFARLGYPVLELSALAGVAPLAEQLTGQRSILVGQSGMGKSTIINTLLPDARAATAEISTALDSGKHTTTYARMYAFGDGWIIDSPGMQAFGLAHIDDEQLLHAFIEFRPLLGQCRFRDCRHDADPGCALREAVERGEIDPLRFAHYHTLRSETAAATKQARGW